MGIPGFIVNRAEMWVAKASEVVGGLVGLSSYLVGSVLTLGIESELN